MILKTIEARDFCSFDHFRFDVPADGFHLLTGENFQDKTGSNGAGKSTLMNALCWCLYGKDTAGDSAGELLRWAGPKTYWVEVTFDTCKIRRQWNPNSLTVDGEVVEKDGAERKIGLTYDQFLMTVVIRQGALHFLDLSASNKLAFLSKVFKLDKWMELSSDAKAERDKFQSALGASESKVQFLSREQVQIEAELELQKELVQKWEVEKKLREERLNEELSATNLRAVQWDDERRMHLESVQEKLDAAYEMKVKSEEAWKEDVDRVLKELDEVSVKMEKAKPDRSQYLQDLKFIRDIELENDPRSLQDEKIEVNLALFALSEQLNVPPNFERCETCKQELATEEAKKETALRRSKMVEDHARLSKRLEELDLGIEERLEVLKEVSVSRQELEATGKELDRQELEWEGLREKYNLLDRERDKLAEAKNPFEAQIEIYEADLSREMENPEYTVIRKYVKDLANLEKETNPHHNQIELSQTRLETVKEDQEKEKQVIADLEQSVSDTEFWKAEFPLVRLDVVKKVISDMELYLNQALGKLGMPFHTIRLSTERELKKGTSANELNLQIYRDDTRVNLNRASGGERQRYRLAVALGIADMIKDRLGVVWNLIWLDEPSMGLSREGIHDILEMLSGWNGCRIMAEHRVEDFGRFDSVIKVTKNEQGISKLEGVR